MGVIQSIVAPTVPAVSFSSSNVSCSSLLCPNAGVDVNMCSFSAANQVTGVFLPEDTLMSNNLLIGPYYEQKCVATGPIVVSSTPLPKVHMVTTTRFTNTYDNYYPLDRCGVYFNYTSINGFNIVISSVNETLYYNTGNNSSSACFSEVITKTPTTTLNSANSVTPSAGASVGVISAVLISFAFVVFFVAFYIISKRRAAAGTYKYPVIASPLYTPYTDLKPNFGVFNAHDATYDCGSDLA